MQILLTSSYLVAMKAQLVGHFLAATISCVTWSFLIKGKKMLNTNKMYTHALVLRTIFLLVYNYIVFTYLYVHFHNNKIIPQTDQYDALALERGLQ